jgi:hypothetical protein
VCQMEEGEIEMTRYWTMHFNAIICFYRLFIFPVSI